MVNVLRQFARNAITWSLFLLLAGVAVASLGGNGIEEATGEAEVEASEYLFAEREDEVESGPINQRRAVAGFDDLKRARNDRQSCLILGLPTTPLRGLNGIGAFLRL